MSRNLKLCFVYKMYNVIVDFSTKSFRLENDLAEFYGLTGPLLNLVVIIPFVSYVAV